MNYCIQICMNWAAINFNWNNARAFLVTAEEGSLSAAAKALRSTQPTLSRQVAALEAELGVSLFQRVGRGLELTETGMSLIERIREMGEAALRVSLTASGQAQDIEGSVRITASEIVAAYQLPEILHKLSHAAPKLSVEIIGTDNIQNLNRREADIAIRHSRPTQPDLYAKKISNVNAWMYASPKYLNTLGPYINVDTINEANFIGFDNVNLLIQGLNEMGFSLSLKNFKVNSESELIRWEYVKSGLGIGIVTEDIGDSETKVQKVLPNMKAIQIPIWLVTHAELKTSRKIRLIFDLINDEFTI